MYVMIRRAYLPGDEAAVAAAAAAEEEEDVGDGDDRAA